MELTTKQKGIITEEVIKLWFLQQGYNVSIPVGDNSRYDLIVEINNDLLKIQIKTGNLTRTPDCLNFACASIKYNSKGTKRILYTKKEIDYFCTLHPETNQIYMVPVEICGNECNLRFVAPKSNNFNGVKMASDYEIEKIVAQIK